MGIGTDTFSQAEMDSISTLYDWVGPEGYGQYTSTTTPGREQSLLMPVASYGALIALIGSENGPPERPEGTPFLVGARVMDREVERDGVIWFAVNDVGFYPNRPADFHRIWYRDNAGVFFVTIVASQ